MFADIIRMSAEFIAERFENSRNYPFIDTKFDITTGNDFAADAAPFYQRDYIYSWIQGRGLESLAEHINFFNDCGEKTLASRLTGVLAAVAQSMENMRCANGGRLGFAMSPEGETLFPGSGEYANFSDLFYSKGLFAAALVLQDETLAQAAEKLFRFVISDIVSDRFRTDQHGFDPKNPVAFVPGKLIQGPRMIALYGLARFAAAQPDEPFYLDTAAEIIRYIYAHHLNRGRYAQLAEFDFVEAVDIDRNPWRDGDAVICDPGHALEFVGLAGKCLLEMRRQDRYADLIAASGEILPELFRHIFDLGFQRAGGIVKSFDLLSRTAVNNDMPWWSLPETLRAGAELLELYPEHADGIPERMKLAERAFMTGFIAAGTHGFACQTRNAAGMPVKVIPAVPDADPGYHTNCSLIDVIKLTSEPENLRCGN